MNIYSIIKDLSQIPSFTGQDELMHPYIRQFTADNLPDGTEIIEIEKSLFVKIPGDQSKAPFALSANIDKLSGKIHEFTETDQQIQGNLDNAAGLGITLYLAHGWCQKEDHPPIYLFLTDLGEYGNIGAFRFKLFFDHNSQHRLPWLIQNFKMLPSKKEVNQVALYTTNKYDKLLAMCDIVGRDNLGLHDYSSAGMIYNAFFDCASFSFRPVCYRIDRNLVSCFKLDIENTIIMANHMIEHGEEVLKSE